MPLLEHTDPLDSRQFFIAIKRLADSLSYGTDRSQLLGQGIEYVQSRPYVQGDPVKTIDWRVSARTGVTHVKEYETPKCLPVWFIVDSSASMTLSSTAISKYQLAVQIAGGLALACIDKVSPVGILGAGSRDLNIKPSLSRDTILTWLHELRKYDFNESTQLAQKLISLSPSLAENTLIFVLSDFHDPDVLRALKRINHKHDVVSLILRDPAEDDLRGAGLIRGKEVESKREFTISAKKEFSRLEDTTAALKKASVDHLALYTNKPILAPLRLFVQSRHLLSR
jgi:uncharacterized protein (DUF58 family)